MIPLRQRSRLGIALGIGLFLVLQAPMLSAIAPDARAEAWRTGFDMEALGGSTSGSGGTNRDAGSGLRITSRVSNGALYGVRLGGTFRRYGGAELTIAETKSTYDADLVDASGTSVAGHHNTSILLLAFNGVLNAPIGPAVPFVTVGGGWAVFMAPNALRTLNYGAGVKMFIAKHVVLRGDYREYVIKGRYKIDAAYIDPTFHFAPVYSFSEDIRLREFSAGLAMSFGNP